LKAYSIFSGSALVGTVLLTGSLILSAQTLSAEPSQSQVASKKTQEATAPVALDASSPSGSLGKRMAVEEAYVLPATAYVATAYSLRGRTASGRFVEKGLIAADPRHLPLGSRVRIEAGAYSGDYLVADTGALVRGRRIDIWTPSSREAMRFGRRTVKLTVLSLGGKKRAAHALKK
jgi:3D (Asp-Asp-Asp) domain-containing protein